MYTLKVNDDLRYRYECFGGLAWKPHKYIYKLNHYETGLLNLLERPRSIKNIKPKVLARCRDNIKNKLLDRNLVVKTKRRHNTIKKGTYRKIFSKINKSNKRTRAKPFWVHIQPYRFCNQECIHCYCDGSYEASRLQLDMKEWKRVIDALNKYGIIDVYVTGGENLILEESFELNKYILENGMGTGISTNAMRVTDTAIRRIEGLGISTIQVSLDGASPSTNNYIRGKDGAFEKTIGGIKKLKSIVSVIINTVVNKVNMHEIEEIVKLCKELDINTVRFFPQKGVGRSESNSEVLLDETDYNYLCDETNRLDSKYQINVNFPRNSSCGAGMSGFAIDEFGNAFPCIFGIRNQDLCLGGISNHEDIDSIWFSSSKLSTFRNMDNSEPCKRCSTCYG